MDNPQTTDDRMNRLTDGMARGARAALPDATGHEMILAALANIVVELHKNSTDPYEDIQACFATFSAMCGLTEPIQPRRPDDWTGPARDDEEGRE